MFGLQYVRFIVAQGWRVVKHYIYGIIYMLTRLFAVDVHLHFERLVRDEQNL